MGGLSADPAMLELSKRYDNPTTRLHDLHRRRQFLAKIPFGDGSHRLCGYPPPPGCRLGHTGIVR
jgi:hypothetical protein